MCRRGKCLAGAKCIAAEGKEEKQFSKNIERPGTFLPSAEKLS